MIGVLDASEAYSQRRGISLSDLGSLKLEKWNRMTRIVPSPFASSTAQRKYSYLAVDAESGWFFRTWPGERCETAFFGLCRFPGCIVKDGLSIGTGYGKGWHYHTWCKTQYADVVSRAHFLKCHLGVIQILDCLKRSGLVVNVRDGGDYWRSRKLERLIKRLEEMHCAVAALAGAVKDAAESLPGSIVAPITAHKSFERLEAKGVEVMRRKRAKNTRRTA
jgi:hypothetical protein